MLNELQFNQSQFNQTNQCSLLGLSIATQGLLSPDNNHSEHIALLGFVEYCRNKSLDFNLTPINNR